MENLQPTSVVFGVGMAQWEDENRRGGKVRKRGNGRR
jgi:hypothetical protein